MSDNDRCRIVFKGGLHHFPWMNFGMADGAFEQRFMRNQAVLVIQQQQASGKVVDSASLPAKDADVDGIVWLPRLLAKARAKLRGELADDVMYGCGGDRKFFRESNIHPAEFLRHVWASRDSDAKVIGWVKARRSGLA